MPLTPKQEEARQELIRRGLISDVNAPGSITGPEPNLPTVRQTRGLSGQPGAPVGTEPQLIEEMRGRLPIVPFKQGLPIQAEERLVEPRRQAAYNELLKRGYDAQQLKTVIDVNKILQPSWQKDILPMGLSTAAAIGIPALINLIPGMAALPEEAVTIPLALKIARSGAGKAVTAATAAGLGGVAGRQIQVGMDEKRKLAFSEAKGEFIRQFLYELLPRAAMGGLKMVAKPFIGKQPIKEAEELITKYGNAAMNLSPAEMDKRMAIKAAEAVSRGSFGADDLWRDFDRKGRNSIQFIASRISDDLLEGAPKITSEQAGKVFGEGIATHQGMILKQVDDLFGPLYNNLNKMTKGAELSTNPLRQAARTALRKDAALVQSGKKGLLSPQARKWANKMLDLKETLPLGKDSTEGMRIVRTELGNAARQLGREMDPGERFVKELYDKSADVIFNPKNWATKFKVIPGETIEAGGSRVFAQGEAIYKGLTPESRRYLNNVNQLYRSMKIALEGSATEPALFPQRMAEKILRDPERIIKDVFPDNNPEYVLRMKTALTEPISGIPNPKGKVLFNQLREAWFEDAIKRSTGEQGFNLNQWYTIKRNMGDSLKTMFSPAELTNMDDVIKAAKVHERVSAMGTPLFTKGIQVAGATYALASAARGDMVGVGKGGAIALSPYAFAKLATNPKYKGFLLAGLNMKPGTSAWPGFVARLVKVLNEIETEDTKKEQLAEMAEHQKRYPSRQPTIQELRGFGGRGF